MRFAHQAATFAGVAVITAGLALPAFAAAGEVPARPEQLTYKPFDFAAPDGDKYRHTLPGGVVVYIVEDHSLPLVKLQATFRTGAFRESANETGLASMTAAMMRQGGTTKLSPRISTSRPTSSPPSSRARPERPRPPRPSTSSRRRSVPASISSSRWCATRASTLRGSRFRRAPRSRR